MTDPEAPRPDMPATALRRFSASLPMLLLRAREAVMLEFRAMLRRQNLTEQQWRVLRALDATGASEVSDLARVTFLLGPSLSRILPELEKRRLIATEPHAVDQRRKIVCLTDVGRALIDAIAPLSEGIYTAMADRLGSERMADLEKLLVEIEQRLTDQPVHPET